MNGKQQKRKLPNLRKQAKKEKNNKWLAVKEQLILLRIEFSNIY